MALLAVAGTQSKNSSPRSLSRDPKFAEFRDRDPAIEKYLFMLEL